MNRKSFIKNITLGIITTRYTPNLKDQSQITLGHNNKRYKIDVNWSKVVANQYPVNDCHEMIQDRKGRLFLLTNHTKNNILIYDRSGRIQSAWGSTYPGAHGLTLFDENGTEVLFICDNNRHQVIKTTLDGRELMTIDYPKEMGQYTKADEFIPTETAIAPNGDIYIADGYGKDFIIQYNYKGEYIRHFGGRGEGVQFLRNAHGVCMDMRNIAHPRIIVSSREENMFKTYDLEGNYISSIPMTGAWVCRPVIKGEYLYAAVLKSSNQASHPSGFVTILDKNDKVVSNLGGNEPIYNRQTLEEMHQTIRIFQYPHDVCIDEDENLYVPQWNSGRVYPYKLSPVI